MTEIKILSRDSNQARGLAEYARAFTAQDISVFDATVLQRVEQFFKEDRKSVV